MSLIAAFLWNKSPRPSISTMIFDDESMDLLVQPTIQYYPKSYFQFRRAARSSIKTFFSQIERWHSSSKQTVVVEFRIVFHAHDIPYLIPAKESKFVFTSFNKYFKKTAKKIPAMTLKPQLRKRLSGKSLKQFKKELRSLYLVSRKKDSGFEYHLWAVALHATAATYRGRLHKIRNKLLSAMWNEKFSTKH